MKTIQLNNVNVIELIRISMNIATTEAKGLMSPNYFKVFNRKIIGLNPGQSIIVGNVTGILIISNQYINDGKPALYICGLNNIEKIAGCDFDLTFSLDKGVLTIKSNYSSAGIFSIAYQNILN